MNDRATNNPPFQSKGTQRVAGSKARALIEAQLEAHNGGIISTFSKYQLRDAVDALHETIRDIEEFINLPLYGIKDPLLSTRLMALPIDEQFISNPAPVWQLAGRILMPLFEPAVVQRYLFTMLKIGAIASAFKAHGYTSFGAGITLDQVGGAIDYFQSRRRHVVSLLYTMPYACKGKATLTIADTLNVVLPQIEHSCISITSLHQHLALMDTLEDFSLETNDTGATASHTFETLDECFMEPERASVIAMYELRNDWINRPQMEDVDPKKIFSAAELRNNVKLIQATYAEFGLNDSDFSTVAELIIEFSRRCRDDYFIELPKAEFQKILRAQTQLIPDELEQLLVNKASSDYATNTNAHEPFISVGDTLLTNVNLLSRFLYYFKNARLGSRRRFQIHGGFIFEDMVKRNLETMGFHVTDIKRINRKEFDVVATHEGTIHNFQCKNNWIDLNKVESNRKLFVRYNRSLVNYYRRALEKERKREHLLKETLKLNQIKHYVISRFPVICTDPEIINYNQIQPRLSAILEKRLPTT